MKGKFGLGCIVTLSMGSQFIDFLPFWKVFSLEMQREFFFQFLLMCFDLIVLVCLAMNFVLREPHAVKKDEESLFDTEEA